MNTHGKRVGQSSKKRQLLQYCDSNDEINQNNTNDFSEDMYRPREATNFYNKRSLQLCALANDENKVSTVEFPDDHIKVFAATPKSVREVSQPLPDHGFFYLQRIGPLTMYLPVDGRNAEIPRLDEHFRGPQFKEGYRFIRKRKAQIVETPRPSLETLLEKFEPTPRRSMTRSSITDRRMGLREKLGLDELNKVYFVLPIRPKHRLPVPRRRVTKEGETSLVPLEWLRKFSTVQLEQRYLDSNVDD